MPPPTENLQVLKPEWVVYLAVAHGGLRSYVGCTDNMQKRLQKHNEVDG